MKKVFKLVELGCANCARKMEDAIGKLPGVTSASISFMTQKLTIEAEDSRFEEIVAEAQKCISRVERHCRIVK